MNKESIFYKVYDFVRENRAVTREEIKLKFNMPNNVVTRYISMLIEQGLLFQGDFIQSKNKKCARIKVVVFAVVWRSGMRAGQRPRPYEENHNQIATESPFYFLSFLRALRFFVVQLFLFTLRFP